jgi:hypothetical protein
MVAGGAPPCSVCGATTRPGSRFCGECGAPVALAGPASTAQPQSAPNPRPQTHTTQTGMPSPFSGQAPNVDAGRYSKVSRSLAVTRGGVGPQGATQEPAQPIDPDVGEPSDAAKGRPKRRRDRTIPGMDVEAPAPSRQVPPAPPAPLAPGAPRPLVPSTPASLVAGAPRPSVPSTPALRTPALGTPAPAAAAGAPRIADAQAPTDPALVLGLGPAGAPLPPIAVPAPEVDDDDDRPTQMRKSASTLASIGNAPRAEFGPQAAAARAATTSASAPGSAPATSAAKDAPPPSGDKSEFQRLLEEVETGFESIIDEGGPVAGPASGRAGSDFDKAEVGTLFAQIAVAHARPIRDFMVEIKLGEPPKSWISFCRPAAKALERSARGMDLAPLADALEGFGSALDLAESESETLIREQARQMLIDAYGDLIARMPEAFGLESESNRREAVILHALLEQVPGLHALGRDRLYEAGMTSLALYFVAKARDLVETARLDPGVAERVVERFVGYRREASDLLPDDGRAIELSRLEALADILERTAASYEEASSSWGAGSGAWRKELRRARADASAQVRLLLARLGELDLIAATDALTTTAKVAALRAFIDDARRSWKPVPESIARLE